MATTYLNGHLVIAECMTSRTAMLTGRIPHRNGNTDFGTALRDDVPTLPELLSAQGYYVGLMGKAGHTLRWRHKAFDRIVPHERLLSGRSPKLYGRYVGEMAATAKATQRPFCILANIEDPHRPWAGSPGERNWVTLARTKARAAVDVLGLKEQFDAVAYAGIPISRKAISPDDAFVPPYLPDLPEIRRELAAYYTSCMRADRSFQAVIDALAEQQVLRNTLVIFLTDNGLAMPLAKGNVYRHSTLASLMIAYPGRPALRGARVQEHVRSVDIMPTVLDVLGMPAPPGLDGRSLLRARDEQDGTPGGRAFTYRYQYGMRAVHDAEYSYIYNDWAWDGVDFQPYFADNPTGRAIQRSAASDAEIDRLWTKINRRQPEELYRAADRYSVKDICAEEPETVARYRDSLLAEMRRTGDPLAARYAALVSNTRRLGCT
jgi:N-sulfoglucosamine sulfohydrolase